MISCSLWYCICSVVEYFASSVVGILYCKFLVDDIKKKYTGSLVLFLIFRSIGLFDISLHAVCHLLCFDVYCGNAHITAILILVSLFSKSVM